MDKKSAFEQLRFEPQRVEKLAQAIRNQPLQTPSNHVIERLVSITRARSNPWLRRLQWAAGIAMTILLWFAFTAIVQPGVQLNWSAKVNQTSDFFVYRAEKGSETYRLVAEVPAKMGYQQYSYLDSDYLPGKAYKYKVEGQGTSGVLLHSIAVDGSADSLLLAYVVLLLISIVASYALIVIGGIILRPVKLLAAT